MEKAEKISFDELYNAKALIAAQMQVVKDATDSYVDIETRRMASLCLGADSIQRLVDVQIRSLIEF